MRKLSCEDIQNLLDQGLSKREIADKFNLRMDTLLHRIRRYIRENEQPPPVAGFVKYWASKNLTHEQIVEKIRKVRGW